ncbi:MAG: hypothetical protein F4207_00475 [Gemmatimonadetes bacterium]|nr:hypothetical protein [Gemmatimonadota bacterium]MYG14889.1 hypothetical protein [Gemmatimonadota bacterium]
MNTSTQKIDAAAIWFDHQTLIRNVDVLLTVYDQAAQGVLDLANSEGYFEGVDPDLLKWPPSRTPDGTIGLEGLGYRAKLIGAIYEGVPLLRDQRMGEAYDQFRRVAPDYYQSVQLYARVREQFLQQDPDATAQFLELYQTVYVEALRASNVFTPDEGEAALAGARLSRVPLSHAQPVAEKLKDIVPEDDPIWQATYPCTLDGKETRSTLRDIFNNTAQKTLEYLAAGELLAVRYNTYTNFAWFGCAVWKIISDAELLAEFCRRNVPSKYIQRKIDGIQEDILLGQAMMVEFFQAHQENPAQLKPTGYWYGHHYTSLTRDMIDLTHALMDKCNLVVYRINQHLKDNEEERARIPDELASMLEPMVVPPLLDRTAAGHFLEYPHVGRNARYSPVKRATRLTRWIGASWRYVRNKLAIEAENLGEREQLEAAWHNSLTWAERTLKIFGITVKVHVDPMVGELARVLKLHEGRYKVLFFPTHQSVFDHPVMYKVLQSRVLLDALGWEDSRPCTILSRSGLTEYVTLRLGSWSTTLFGVNAAEFDRLLEEVDGYVVLPRAGDTNNATQRFAGLLEKRPGIIYAAGTTAAFDIQSIPLQHGLFSKIPPDVVIIPMAFRGIHSIWPKCPRRNIRINPGQVEVVVAPPMMGETTLFPRRRSLRPQIEPAALFQAVQLVHLLNPNHRP